MFVPDTPDTLVAIAAGGAAIVANTCKLPPLYCVKGAFLDTKYVNPPNCSDRVIEPDG